MARAGTVPFHSPRFARRWKMSRVKRRKGRSGKGTSKTKPADRKVRVSLVPTVELLHGHLAKALCEEAFRDVRTTERQRKWTLYALARFWLAVIFEAPRSLSQLLD